MTDTRESYVARLGWIINTCVDQIGTVFFGILIFATIRQKRLHNTCQIFIGIYAFCSLLSKLQILLPFAVFILPGPGKIPRIYCAIVQIIPIGGCMNVFSFMLVIAIDRMLAIFLPIWYSTRNDKKYLKIMCSLSLLFPLMFVGYVVRSLIQDPFLKVQCYFPDLVGSDGQMNLDFAQLGLNFLTLFCYILMFLKLFYNNKNEQATAQRKAVYKTLCLIMGIQLAGYTLTLLAYNVMNHISSNFSSDQQLIINCILNCASSISSTVEVPALFVVSTEHRLAIKDEFRCFFSLFSTNENTNKNNVTHHTTINVVKNQNKATKINNFVKVSN